MAPDFPACLFWCCIGLGKEAEILTHRVLNSKDAWFHRIRSTEVGWPDWLTHLFPNTHVLSISPDSPHSSGWCPSWLQNGCQEPLGAWSHMFSPWKNVLQIVLDYAVGMGWILTGNRASERRKKGVLDSRKATHIMSTLCYRCSFFKKSKVFLF